jgi:hypothetical protein
MQAVETSIRITRLDKRHGTENEETTTAHRGPSRRAIRLVVICRGKLDSVLDHWVGAGACVTIQSFQGHASFSFPLAPRRPPLRDGLPAASVRRGGLRGDRYAMRRTAPQAEATEFGVFECGDDLWRVMAAPHPAVAHV